VRISLCASPRLNGNIQYVHVRACVESKSAGASVVVTTSVSSSSPDWIHLVVLIDSLAVFSEG
jgi:hypothetical protein